MIARRPAESSALAGALALLLARLLGVDDADTVTALAIVLAAVPSIVTWAVGRFRRPVASASGENVRQLAQAAADAGERNEAASFAPSDQEPPPSRPPSRR